MTVSSKVPIVRYNGNGVITKFDWDWDMLEESTIYVIVDNEYSQDWVLDGNSVSFFEPPEDGAEIIIFRRTQVHMPENYSKFRRFAGEKTETSLDRATMIAQERRGDAEAGQPPNGIVGGANLFTRKGEFYVVVESERGTDAVLNLWSSTGQIPPDPYPPENPDPPPVPDVPPEPEFPPVPDPNLLWPSGEDIYSYNTIDSNSAPYAETTLKFWMDASEGDDPTKSQCEYDTISGLEYIPWYEGDVPDQSYWMRVIVIQEDARGSFNSVNVFSNGIQQSLNTPFLITARDEGGVDAGPAVSITTSPDPAPSESYAVVRIDICPDSNGLPNGEWVFKYATLHAAYSPAGSNIWSPSPTWNLSDSDPYDAAECNITALGTAGTITAQASTTVTESWSAAAPNVPDPENYEVMLSVVGGDALAVTGGAVNTWIGLNTDPTWKVKRRTTEAGQSGWEFDILVRKIGESALTKKLFLILEKVVYNPAGSVSWESVFGNEFGAATDSAFHRTIIPPEGLSIRFTVPNETNVGCGFNALEVYAGNSVWFAINQTVLDVTTPPVQFSGGSQTILGSINYSNPYDIILIPGQTYYWNIKSTDGSQVWWNLRFFWQQY